jgi:hypothetical protein
MIGLIQLIVLCTAPYAPAQDTGASTGIVTSVTPEKKCGIIRSQGVNYFFSFKDCLEWKNAVYLKVGSPVHFNAVKGPKGWQAVDIDTP